MKIDDLIYQLQIDRERYGNIECVVWSRETLEKVTYTEHAMPSFFGKEEVLEIC